MRIGSFQLMKSLNKSTILNLIRTRSPISRAAIAKITKLTPPTVTNIVTELIASNLVIETELGQSKGGRKPIMLEFNENAYCVLAISICPHGFEVGKLSLSGEVLQKHKVDVTLEEDILKSLQSNLQNLLNEEERKVLGIGLSYSSFNEENVSKLSDIKKFLETNFETKVQIKKDIHAMTLSEHWFGKVKKLDNFVFLNIDEEVSAGLFFNGSLMLGQNKIAGNIMHFPVDNERLCGCGNIGCSAVNLTLKAFFDNLPEMKMKDKNLNNCLLEAVTNENLKNYIEKTGMKLGKLIGSLSTLLDPKKIFLVGGLLYLDDLLLNSMNEELKALKITTEIKYTSFKENTKLVGAASLVLNKMFSVDEQNEIEKQDLYSKKELVLI